MGTNFQMAGRGLVAAAGAAGVMLDTSGRAGTSGPGTAHRARAAGVLAAITLPAALMLAPAASGQTIHAAAGWPAPGARSGVITTVAGGPGGPAGGRRIAVNQPCGVASGRRGVYFTEQAAGLVRWLDPATGVLRTVAAAGPAGFNGWAGGRSALRAPCSVVRDRAGNLIIAETNTLRVRAARTGVFYGQEMRAGRGYLIGGRSFAQLQAVGADGHGNLLVTESGASQYYGSSESDVVWVLAGARGTFYGQAMVPGRVYPLAGQDCGGTGSCDSGLAGDGGPALRATFGWELLGVTADGHGNVVIADTVNDRIRVVAATSGRFYGRVMTAGDIYTVAGGGTAGDGGPATLAGLNSPGGLAFDRAANLVLADSGDQKVRVVASRAGWFYGQKMTAGDIYSIAGDGTPGYGGDGGPALRAGFGEPSAVAFDAAGNLIVADQPDCRVRLIAARTGRFYGQQMRAGHVYTIAGNGDATYSGDSGLATRAQISASGGVFLFTGSGGLAASRNGSFAIADSGNYRVRVVAGRNGGFYGIRMRAGHIYTVAGTGVPGTRGGGGPATRAQLSDPVAVAFDHAGNILVSDTGTGTGAGRLRVIAASTGMFYGRHMTAGCIYTLAGSYTSYTLGLATDSSGNVIAADDGSSVQVLAAKTGTFYGQPMTAGQLYTLNPAQAGQTQMSSLTAAVDHHGNIVIGSFDSVQVIAVRTGTFYGRRMKAGSYYTVAGGVGARGFHDGIPAVKSAVDSLSGVAVDKAGNLLLAVGGENLVRVIAERPGTFYGVKMTTGDIYTVAGIITGGFSGDGGPARNALLHNPSGIAPYGTGLLVLDSSNYRVRKVTG